MRDYRKLRAFGLADVLVMEVYRVTKGFPADERFGLVSQMRRAAVSVGSNIVEGCARGSLSEYLNFINLAHSSAHELWYQVSIAVRLGYVIESESEHLIKQCKDVTSVLGGLVGALKRRKSGEL